MRSRFWSITAVCSVGAVLAGRTSISGAGTTRQVSSSFSARPSLRITEVNPATGQADVTNISTTANTPPAAFLFSHGSNTNCTIPAGTEFAPGGGQSHLAIGTDFAGPDNCPSGPPTREPGLEPERPSPIPCRPFPRVMSPSSCRQLPPDWWPCWV